MITRVILAISDFIVGWWWLLAGILITTVFLVRRWVKTPEGRRKWHAWQLVMPLFGRVNRLVAVSRFCRASAARSLSSARSTHDCAAVSVNASAAPTSASGFFSK